MARFVCWVSLAKRSLNGAGHYSVGSRIVMRRMFRTLAITSRFHLLLAPPDIRFARSNRGCEPSYDESSELISSSINRESAVLRPAPAR